MPHIQPTDLLHTKAIASQHGCVVIDRANGGSVRHSLYRRVGRRLVFVGARSTPGDLYRLVQRACNLKGAAQ
mgnify:CR=1 FL=1